jgi:hypothetical protein
MNSVGGSRKFRIKKTHARPLGPGELARALELRKRGLHLRLIEAGGRDPTHPKPQGTDMTEQELESLKTVIRFLWRDEQKNFEECELNDGGPPDDHIFSHLETLGRYVTDKQADDSILRQTGTHTR